MKEFKMYADIVYHDSFQEFMEGENVGAEDFILTNEFLYNQYVKPWYSDHVKHKMLFQRLPLHRAH